MIAVDTGPAVFIDDAVELHYSLAAAAPRVWVSTVTSRSMPSQFRNRVKEAELPPVLSLVIDQYPSYESRGHRIARIAENALTQAGAEVIPMEDF